MKRSFVCSQWFLLSSETTASRVANDLNIRKYEIWRQARVAVRKACRYYFLPNSKRAVSIMSFYGHRRVSSHKPLVIIRSLAPNILP
jgi:hypothetical protein